MARRWPSSGPRSSAGWRWLNSRVDSQACWGDSRCEHRRRSICETVRHPVGVCVGITPFQIPEMGHAWDDPGAWPGGNTFCSKPGGREGCALRANRRALARARDCRRGCSNIVHGAGVSLRHARDRCAAIRSSARRRGRHSLEGHAEGKRVQAAGGAKNKPDRVPDADLARRRGPSASAFG